MLFLSQKETNIAIIIKIIVALLVEKKLPEVLKGKNSTNNIKKTGIFSSACIFDKQIFLSLKKYFSDFLNRESIKNKIISSPNIPKSDIISI